MESPFSSENTNIVMYLEPFLDSYNKTYLNILTFSGMPKGPLEKMVARINPPALSEYQSYSSMSGIGGCMHALLRYPKSGMGSMKKNNHVYMYADDIPSVLSYLISNGYTIDTHMTNMLLHTSSSSSSCSSLGHSGNRKMICIFSYNGGVL
jgi:hypothetical protein